MKLIKKEKKKKNIRNIKKNIKVNHIYIMFLEKLPIMYQNYENRVKEFIIDMNNPETKIEIKDYEGRINNPKTEMSEEKEIQKPFIFKGYTTEEDRIKDSVKRNRYLFNLPDYDELLSTNNSFKKINKKRINTTSNISNDRDKNIREKKLIKKKSIRGLSESEVNKYKYILKNDLIIQPEMRFKPRTDLERVYDILNGYKYGQTGKEKEILANQLKNIDLYNYKNTQELNNLIREKIKSKFNDKKLNKMNNSYDEINNEYNSDLNNKNKLYFNPKSINYKLKPWIKRDDLNKDAYKLLTSYHYKTHFKAAKEIAANKSNKNINDNNKDNINLNKKENFININNEKKFNKNKNSCLLLPNLFKKKHIINKSSTDMNNILEKSYHKKKNQSNNLIDIKIEDQNEFENLFNFDLDIFNEEDKNEFDDKYTKNKNPFKQNIYFDKNKIKLLTNIAFQKNDNNKEKENLENNFNNIDENDLEEIKLLRDEKNYDDNNIIMIGNEKYNKNNEFDIIANKILGNCNILKHKSKINNTILKKRN